MDLALPIAVWLSALVLVVAGMVADLRRRARARRLDPVRFFDTRTKRRGIDRAGHRCEHKPLLWFRCRTTEGLQADHIVPWSKGGPTSWENLQLLCRRHNRAKSAWIPSPLYRWRLAARRKRYSRA